ncbi:hypothetical protein DFH09DRAFT_486225 [Mycena vulgaris]|nr:hypothetical protein DFH09DRAFT_486225 [Mycena vulgaris]
MAPSPGTQPLYTFLSILTVLLASDPSGFHHYLEPHAPVFVAHSIFALAVFHGAGAAPHNAHETHHIYSHLSLPSSPEAPLDIPLDAEVWHGAARYLPAVGTDTTTPIPPFLCPLSHLTNFICKLRLFLSSGAHVIPGLLARLKTRAKASDERRMYSVAGGCQAC